MIYLIVVPVVLILTVVWAARTHSGSWLVYFESIARAQDASARVEDEMPVTHQNLVSTGETEADRVISLPKKNVEHSRSVRT